MITRTILAKVAEYAYAEGKEDYFTRANDVECGDDPSWAWPFDTADVAYINAVTTDEICRELGMAESMWDDIADTWFNAFKAGYVDAHSK